MASCRKRSPVEDVCKNAEKFISGLVHNKINWGMSLKGSTLKERITKSKKLNDSHRYGD